MKDGGAHLVCKSHVIAAIISSPGKDGKKTFLHKLAKIQF